MNELREGFKHKVESLNKYQEREYKTSFPKLSEYSYSITSKSQHTYIIGATGIGCLYGVYALLRQLGFEFFAPGDENEMIPDITDINEVIIEDVEFFYPSFPGRRMYAYKKNRLTPKLVDWIAKVGMNIWGAEDLVPGMRKRGIKMGCGNHDMLETCGYKPDYCLADKSFLERFLRNVVDNLKDGIWKDADYLDFIGGDMAPRCECEFCRSIGNYADREIYFVNVVRNTLVDHFNNGYLNRDIPIIYYAYGETEDAPTKNVPSNYDYLNVFPQMWSFRCWAHNIFDDECDKDWIHRCYAGQPHEFKALRRSNISLLSNLESWREKTGSCGFGFYPYNAGLYFQDSVYFHHFKDYAFLEDKKLPVIGHMHMPPEDSSWGLKKIFWYISCMLMLNAKIDPETLIRKYFDFYFKEESVLAEKMARLLDNALLPIQKIKFKIVEPLLSDPNLDIRELFDEDSHLSIDEGEKSYPSLKKCLEMATEAYDIALKLNRISKEDVAWIEYSLGIVSVYYYCIQLREISNDKSPKVFDIGEKLYGSALKLSKMNYLPRLGLTYNVDPNPLEATSIAPIIVKMLHKIGIDTKKIENVLSPSVQDKIYPIENKGDNMPQEPLFPTYIAPMENVDSDYLSFFSTVKTGLRNNGISYLEYKNKPYWVVCGEVINGSPKIKGYNIDNEIKSKYVCKAFKGMEQIWEAGVDDPIYELHYGPYPNIIEIPENNTAIVTLSASHSNVFEKGDISAYDLVSGRLLWEYRTETRFGGNGSVIAADINKDGLTELVFGLNGEIACLESMTGRKIWSFKANADGRVSICHGSLSMADIDGDGEIEIIFGTEYGTRYEKDRSDIFMLTPQGKVKRSVHNIQGDLGSTNVAISDVDNDGKYEITVGSLNLFYRKPRHNSMIHCFENYLGYRYYPRGSYTGAFAVTDYNNDGIKEACFLSSVRDGGPAAYGNHTIRIIDLSVGEEIKKIKIPRSWLSSSPLAYDFDGDGTNEFLVGTFYGSGYGCMSEDTFADIYIIDEKDEIIFKHSFKDAVYQPALISNDGFSALLALPCYDGNVYLYKIKSHKKFNRFICPAANYKRTGEVAYDDK